MAAPDPSSLALDISANTNRKNPAVRTERPADGALRPVLFASPHSGRDYSNVPEPAACLSPDLLRRSEDAYVDTLIDCAPDYGACLVAALFPRVFIDANRGPWELDPGMFSDALPAYADTQSKRAASGLGVVPRIGAEGRPLYRRRLRFAEARERLALYYAPYHAALDAEIAAIRARFGYALVLDMHSMPEQSARGADFVLGDRFGTSCSPGISDRVEACIADLGYSAARNVPYAGGYTTEHYGRPESGVHVIQIEINRGLYLDERTVALKPESAAFRHEMRNLVGALSATDWQDHLQP